MEAFADLSDERIGSLIHENVTTSYYRGKSNKVDTDKFEKLIRKEYLSLAESKELSTMLNFLEFKNKEKYLEYSSFFGKLVYNLKNKNGLS